MALPQHQQVPSHNTEVSCDSSGAAVSVRISDNKSHQHLGQETSLGAGGEINAGANKPCKYSISSSCSSGESGVRKTIITSLRNQRKVPQLFERSAAQCWDPKFDSSILEEACRERCFPQTQRRFRYVLLYLAIASILWGIYFGVNSSRCDSASFLAPTAAFLIFCLLLFLFTFTMLYARIYNHASLLLIVVTFAITLAPQMQAASLTHHKETVDDNRTVVHVSDSVQAPCISPVGTFSLCMEVLLLLYSVLHLRLYVSVLLGLLYSVLFESLGWLHLTQGGSRDVGLWAGNEEQKMDLDALWWLGPGKALLHLCAHVIGIHLFIMSEVRSRSTFLKVGQAIMHGKDLEVEKALKERMIHSVMPRRVADELMKQGDEECESSGKRYSAGTCSAVSAAAAASSSPKNNKRKKTSIPRGQIIFRPFNMKRMEPVSILFADIVGFTKMSANKSAHALVGLLNDLFGRFDRLCELTCCEKISTLGDCYYCVAGCPEPRSDHAFCCVEMGLGMIQAIEQFCQETRETVDMRVGVHTGTVLCGILGMKRFKFDVWSNDVNLANLMEQLGVAGKVHLSEITASFLDDRYQREDGRVSERVGQSVVTDQLKGLKTYLISGKKTEPSQCGCSQVSQLGHDCNEPLISSPRTHTPDITHSTAAEAPCLSCSVVIDPGGHQSTDESATQNGCQDEHFSNSNRFTAGRSPKALNGLLSPLSEEAVTASQTSLYEMLQEKERKLGGTSTGGGGGGGTASMDHSALIPLRSKNFRERSDVHFVDVIKEDSLMKDYFFKPPINKLSLNFLEKSLESAYRCSYQEEVVTHAPVQTFASPTFSSFLDVLLSCAVFLALTLACFLRPLVTMETPPATTIGVAISAALLELGSLVLSIRMTFYLDDVLSCTQSLLRVVSGWVPRHVIGAVLVSLPAVSVFSHLTYSLHLPLQSTVFLCCAVIIAIIQYCNFCQLSFWMRSVLATAAGVSLLALLYSPLSRYSTNDVYPVIGNLTNNSVNMGSTTEPNTNSAPMPPNLPVPEAFLAFFLLLLLVWFLNREFEVSYRLHYHGNVEADKHRIKIQNMRDQADWLLRNIIPIHVAEQLKVTQSYSKNHDNVGVIFASIVNFSEFYEESYEGGKECYRVLNELIGDFDELLRKPAFANVEKIKTIGATYMAASGLNGRQFREQTHPHAHLRALFEFALEMMHVVEDFNKNMLGFKFKLRIGFNHGPLTAGVIGTTKLLYDIWGDTVNIASRMDTTGVECRIQVSEESHCVLSSMDYAFDYRGTVNVKGKGQMRTYLYPKMNESGHMPKHQLAVSSDLRPHVDGSIGRSPIEELANKEPSVPLKLPSPSLHVPAPGGHDVPLGLVSAASQCREERHRGSKDTLNAPELKEEAAHLAPAPSPTATPLNSVVQPSHPQQVQPREVEEEEEEEEEEEVDELTKLKAAEHL